MGKDWGLEIRRKDAGRTGLGASAVSPLRHRLRAILRRMITSMTGFARAETTADFGGLSVELKTVNHRYFELSLRLPEELRPAELAIRKQIGAAVRRGKSEATFRLNADAGTSGLTLNTARMAELADAAREVAAQFGSITPPDPLRVLAWPGVVAKADVDTDTIAASARTLLAEALEALTANRAREGEQLAAVLTAKADEIDRLAAAVRAHLPQIRAEWEARLRERLDQFQAELDPARIEQEFLLLANKTDAEEELDRLAAHTTELRAILQRSDAVGRRLDFLMQELNREANTLGSKSQDATITKLAVDLKVTIEQLREQIQNIE